MKANKTEQALLNCLSYVIIAINKKDKDMLRSYWEQANDLIIDLTDKEGQ